MGCEFQQISVSVVWDLRIWYYSVFLISAVNGVADSIIGSSKFKGVHGLSFSWVGWGKTNVSLTLETPSGTPVVHSFLSLHCIHLQRTARNWTVNSVVFSNQMFGSMFPGSQSLWEIWVLLIVYVDVNRWEVLNILRLWRHKQCILRSGPAQVWARWGNITGPRCVCWCED